MAVTNQEFPFTIPMSGDDAKGFVTGKTPKEDLDRLFTGPQIEYEGFDPTLSGHYMSQFDALGQAVQGRQINPNLEALLMAQAQGQAPSAAELQMRAGLERALAGQRSAALSNPSVSPALAQRLAAQQGTQLQMQTNQQMSAMRAQEQARAQQAMAQYALGQQQLNDQLTQYYMQQGFDRDQAELLARQELSRQRLETDIANQQTSQRSGGGALSAVGGFVGSLFGAGPPKA